MNRGEAGAGRRPLRVGVVGCGAISKRYFAAAYDSFEVVACADLDRGRAEAAAEAHGLVALEVEELLADPTIDVILNLTIPAAHAPVSRAALEAGHHVYQEKPLALGRAEAADLLATASRTGRLLGSAPDTFLGAGLQLCRHLIDSGAIGEPVAASAAFLCHGHESWHPDPGFYYRKGGGPLLDMGPYYLTALVSLLGPVAAVDSMARTTFAERVVTSSPRAGERIAVEVPTHVAAVLELVAGPLVTLVTSFDVWPPRYATFEIYGTEGTLALPDPNTFGGPVRLLDPGGNWSDVSLDGRPLQQRGVGLADLAVSAMSGRLPRAGGELAHHVLDVMLGVLDSAESGRRVALQSRAERPAPVPVGLAEGEIDP
ncbi:MAG: Gfo/Idh/MocA family oxidoreductase [Actinomycetota bacterium]|nr:Gfo/Idh/MocA family oxidoreductase [Actinomycetota bacterium]